MKNIRIVPLLSLATIAVASALAAVVITMPVAVAPAFADTPGVSPTCFSQTANPHPTSPIGQTTDTLFCAPQSPNSSNAGSGSGGTGSGGSTGSGAHGGGQTGSSTTAAGTTSGGGSSSLAGSGSSGSPTGSGSTGSKASPVKSTASPSTGFFGGLVAFLGAAGGLVFLFGFLILLALILLAVGVAGWLRRRGSAGWNFARVTHRA